MATTTNLGQGRDKGIEYNELQQILGEFDSSLQLFKDAKIISITQEEPIISIKYEVNNRAEVIFVTPYCLLASIKFTKPFFKSPLENSEDSHTSHKTLC